MYHVSNDKRTKESAELIYQALTACMKEKAFNKISITDIQRVSGVARTTFYRDFDDLVDVLQWKCDLEYKKAMNAYVNLESHDADENEFLLFFFDYWMDNYEILDSIISIGRYDIIFHCHSANSEIITSYFSAKYEVSSDHYNYYMTMRIAVFVSVLIEWAKSGRKESASELVDIIINTFKDAVTHSTFF